MSHYSFLQGASSPEALVKAAHQAGYAGIAITDEASLAGVVKAHSAAQALDMDLLIGSQFHVHEGLHLVVIAPNLTGYQQLSTLISRARRAAPKGHYSLSLQSCLHGLSACHVILIPTPNTITSEHVLSQLKQRLQGRLWLGLTLHYDHQDQARYDHTKQLRDKYDIPWVAIGQVRMHCRSRLDLLRAMTAIRLKTTVDELGFAAPQNSEVAIRPVHEIQRTYPTDAIHNTQKIHDECRFSLEELRYLYPKELVPRDHTPTSYLRQEVSRGIRARWPNGADPDVLKQVNVELNLIEELKFECYFLTVYDIVQFARQQHILCQGRGSAANSVVCFCLGITEVDPHKVPVLFERFISRERKEPPDIDVDFEHHRREEVIQYIYQKYGRHRAALLCSQVTYRPKSAIRDIGKALGFDELVIQKVSKSLAWWDKKEHIGQRLQESQIDQHSPRVKRWLTLVEALISQPRHLSQHVGGFFIAHHNIEHVVPIENASMKDRTIIQWDKDDIETLGLLKIDVLALGMLSAIKRAFTSITQYRGIEWTLAKLPQECPKVYEMLSKADSLGVFQVESRAQMAMLPRLKPTTFYDLVVQVAIVRPGPIQGKMVHPYLKRRERMRATGQTSNDLPWPSPAIQSALGRTLGVPIFQEQVIQLARLAAGFTPGKADALRRSMGSWRQSGALEQYQQDLRQGLHDHGYSEGFAERLIEQINGFGSYGFPESHAASFALLVYASAWLKCHEPAAFYMALLNAQPMGFYSPSQIIQDAKRHNITLLPIDVCFSHWDHTLEQMPAPHATEQPSIRLGLRLVKGLHKDVASRLREALQHHNPTDFDHLVTLAQLSPQERALIASANGFRTFYHRQQAHWQSAYYSAPTALFDQSTLAKSRLKLQKATQADNCISDYNSTGTTLGPHPMIFLRHHSELRGCQTHTQLLGLRHRSFVRLAGLVTGRQRPGTASGVVFLTLEDETGNTNIIVWPSLVEKFRKAVLHSSLLLIQGTLERQGHVIHIIAGEIEDLSGRLHHNSSSRDFH